MCKSLRVGCLDALPDTNGIIYDPTKIYGRSMCPGVVGAGPVRTVPSGRMLFAAQDEFGLSSNISRYQISLPTAALAYMKVNKRILCLISAGPAIDCYLGSRRGTGLMSQTLPEYIISPLDGLYSC